MTIVRPLRPDEWPAFRALRLRALENDPGRFIRSIEEERARPVEHWRAMLDSDDGVLFGLFEAERLIGISAVFIDQAVPAGDTAALGMTWIEPDHRGRGLSALLYPPRIAWARARGAARIAVSHREGNEPSRRAMLAHGFVATGRTAETWPDGGRADNVHYELRI